MQSYDSADLALDPPALADLVVRDLAGGKDVITLVDSVYGTAMLNQVAVRLRKGRDRVIQVFSVGDGELEINALSRQLGWYTEPLGSVLSVAAADLDVAILTTLDPTCDRIILLVDNAESLTHEALLTVQLACRLSIRLKLVFAGLPGLFMTLDHPELSALEGRLLRGVRYTTAAEQPNVIVSEVSALQRRRKMAYAVVACAVLALSGLLTFWPFTPRYPGRPGSPEVAMGPSVFATIPSEQAVQAAPNAESDPNRESVVIPKPITPPEPGAETSAGKKTRSLQEPAARRNTAQTPRNLSRFAVREMPSSRVSERKVGGYRAASEYEQSVPGNLARREPYPDYIGTFAAGPGGVRSFQYRP